MANDPRVSSTVSLEMRGTWKSSMRRVLSSSLSPAGRAAPPGFKVWLWGLLGVQLDDELFLDRSRDLAALRLAQHLGGERIVIGLQPRRHLSRQLGGVADDRVGGRARLDRDHVALAHLVAGDVDPPAVDGPVTVADELAGLAPRRGEPQADQ